jgi:hypothetical protein
VRGWFGIRFENTSAVNDTSRIEYCVIEYCKAAGDSSRGGALSVAGFSKLRVSNSVFRWNVADYGAVAYCANYGSPTICGCLMVENYAFVGGSAVFCLDAYPTLTNNTIVNNHVLNEEVFYATATIHNHISKSRPINSILWGNTSNYFLGLPIHEGQSYYVTYCDIEGGYEGEGNLDEDPQFAGVEPHPYALADGSACINAGAPETGDLWLPDLDLAGNPRIGMDRIDIGAYEWRALTGVVEFDKSRAFQLLCSTPNPFVSSTSIRFGADGFDQTDLAIYDLTGRKVRRLAHHGPHTGVRYAIWDGRDDRGSPMPSGLYLARITNGRQVSTHKLVIAR